MAKQLGAWFGLPVCTAVFVSIAFLAYFIQSISAEISAYIGYGILLKQIFTTGGILLLLLLYKYLDSVFPLCGEVSYPLLSTIL